MSSSKKVLNQWCHQFQNETVEIGNESFIEDVANPSSGSGVQPGAQPENPDADNDNENDQDLSVDPEPPMEQAVSR